MATRSSGTTPRARTSNFLRSSASATAGPERSTFSPREHESLTVSTAAGISFPTEESGVEEDIFPFGCGVPLRFVEQAQAFHQQTLRVERRGFLRRFLVEINLEVSFRPAEHFENRFVAGNRAIGGVFGLTLAEVNLALVIAVRHG